MLKEKLISLESYQNWLDELNVFELLEIFEYTKQFPIVNLKIRKYCYVHGIREYPTKNGKYLKFRDGKYGFYNNKYISDLLFPKNSEELKFTKKRTFLSNSYYDELLRVINFNKEIHSNNLDEMLFCYKYNIKTIPTCLICKKKLAFNKKYGIFCSDKCRLCEDGIKISNLNRESFVLSKYGVPFVFNIEEIREKGRATCMIKWGTPNGGLAANNWRRSKWHIEICEHLKTKINEIRCLDNEFIIFLSEREKIELNQRCIYPDIKFKNKIIELNGDFFHANPKKYKSDDLIFKSITANDIWDKDQKRIECFNSNGFETLIIWESDYHLNKEIILNKCYDFLISH